MHAYRRTAACATLILTLLVLAAGGALAQQAGTATITVGSATASVNGNAVNLEVPAWLTAGAPWGSVRPIAQALGAGIAWDPATRQVRVEGAGHTLVFTVGSATAQIDGLSVALGAAVSIQNGRAQVPLLVLAQGLGFEASFDAAAGIVVIGGAPAGSGQTVVTVYDHPDLGPILADEQGRILYVFLRDEAGVSNCYDTCEQNWPVLLAQGRLVAGDGVAGRLGVTTRRDGTRQVTYDGMPLYYFVADQATGQANGQGVNGVWFVVPPDPATRATPELRIAHHPDYGQYLVDAYGRSLYLFTRDEGSTSNCYDQCEANWPVLRGTPVAAGELSGTVGSTMRNDGTSQVTYNGVPLYYWVADRVPGDTTGQGVNDVWYLVAPGGTAITGAGGR